MTACAAKPLHRLTHELEHVSHAALRGELSVIVALAEEELGRPASRHAADVPGPASPGSPSFFGTTIWATATGKEGTRTSTMTTATATLRSSAMS